MLPADLYCGISLEKDPPTDIQEHKFNIVQRLRQAYDAIDQRRAQYQKEYKEAYDRRHQVVT